MELLARPCHLAAPLAGRGRRARALLPGAGASILEVSHRSSSFRAILDEAESNLRELLEVPDEHRLLFLQGGASLQFSMAPMNLLRGSARTGAYVVTARGARRPSPRRARKATSSSSGTAARAGYSSVPDLAQLNVADDSAYLHVTSNETIQGVELPAGSEPPPGPFLVADTSSDFLSRSIPLERYGLLYAGAQKNAGPAGLTIALIREDVLARIPEGLPSMLDYRTYAEHGSLYNTPPVFAIDVLMLVTRWIRDEVGGLDKMHERNGERRPRSSTRRSTRASVESGRRSTTRCRWKAFERCGRSWTTSGCGTREGKRRSRSMGG